VASEVYNYVISCHCLHEMRVTMEVYTSMRVTEVSLSYVDIEFFCIISSVAYNVRIWSLSARFCVLTTLEICEE